MGLIFVATNIYLCLNIMIINLMNNDIIKLFFKTFFCIHFCLRKKKGQQEEYMQEEEYIILKGNKYEITPITLRRD